MQHSGWPLEAVDIIAASLALEDRPAWYRAQGYHEDARALERDAARRAQEERRENEYFRQRVEAFYARYTFDGRGIAYWPERTRGRSRAEWTGEWPDGDSD